MKRVLLLGLIGLALVGCGKKTCPDVVTDAWTQAQYIVKSRLKSPSTADFPYPGKGLNGLHETGEIDGVCHYYISGDVDAQNSFGGIVRNRYSMNLKYNISTEKWVYENLEIK
ncbi:hypothetical protein ACGH6Q_10900 [Gilliamella sp. BG2]|jgi:hypothetical protein|uniref:hypothetical protein n=1 Tax=Gilliamella sp. BG2 TaxID=3351509 RepID=UPI003986246E